MIIIPAIDIIKGRVVRLYQGDFAKEKIYSEDPLEAAIRWQDKGAGFLHIVDLDGAKEGSPKNKELITSIIKNVKMRCGVGGGIRAEGDVEYYLDNGAARVVLGTKALEDKDFLRSLISRFKEKIVVGIDFKEGCAAKAGWLKKTEFKASDFAKSMKDIGVERVIVTDISVDGTLKGPNIISLREILDHVDIKIIASGGVSSLYDIRKLREINNKNLEAVIIGKALYEGKLDLEEAITACK
ncbi:MAG: 1-(5-phosphoribosyl)-5-[(5-phosphoribosylamino)methylideneamino]imidazole-4-carboxamide isomerase [Candidatus Omnitrophota bacterium]